KKPVHRDERRLRPQNSEVRALLADSSLLESKTGWRAQTSLRDGLERTIGWWEARLSEGRVRHEMGYMT
ncbi:MAG: NAD-dependent dehydratase, partial [Mesorhizobium sp.]